eukprot:COSAG06_NODE_7086_length_2639_cov_121.892520_1_plen_60_part_10
MLSMHTLSISPFFSHSVCVCVPVLYIYIFNLLTCNLRAGKIVSVLEGGYGELKEQGGKWV